MVSPMRSFPLSGSSKFDPWLVLSEAQNTEASERHQSSLIVGIVSSLAIIIVIVICLFIVFFIVRRRRNAMEKPTDILHQDLTLDGDSDEDDDHTSIVTVTVPGIATTTWALSDDTAPTRLWTENLTNPSGHFAQSTLDVL
jgi:flagellar biosynthesis/type III secretory pathway M-ring protein FliF/YscJ